MTTGNPRTGLIGMGEVLNAKQREALGEEKIRELIQRGVLAVLEEAAEEAPTPANLPEQAPAPLGEGGQDTPQQEAEDTPQQETVDAPTLDIALDDIVGDGAEAPEEKPKRGRKGKQDEG